MQDNQYEDLSCKTNEKLEQVCKNCYDIKMYHSINLCYNYEPKFRQVKKIIKPVEKSWSNYLKSYFVKLKSEIKIIYSEEPVYYKYNLSYNLFYNPGLDLKNKLCVNIADNSCNPKIYPSVNSWLSLVNLKHIINSTLIDISNYIVNVFNLFKPEKYITQMEFDNLNKINKMKNEEAIIQTKISFNKMIHQIEQMKNQMLCDLKNNSYNYKILMDNNIKEMKYELNNEFKQKTKNLMKDIKDHDKKHLIRRYDVTQLNGLNLDYEKIEKSS